MNTLDCWDEWPLDGYAWSHRHRASLFVLPFDEDFPIEAKEALKKCAWDNKDVVVAWISRDFAVVETLEPEDSDEVKQELADLNLDWRLHYIQSLDIVVGRGLSDARIDELERRLDRLSVDATKIAEVSLSRCSPRLPLYVLDDRHISSCTVVLFSVGPVNAVEAATNRAFVKSWAAGEFASAFKRRIQTFASEPVELGPEFSATQQHGMMKSAIALSDGFASRLREARERLGSRQAIADRIGISDVTLWRWESGKSSPTVAQLHKMQVLGFDVIQLLTGSSAGA
jgi:DNA-binding XRE family transcriptional regulator